MSSGFRGKYYGCILSLLIKVHLAPPPQKNIFESKNKTKVRYFGFCDQLNLLVREFNLEVFTTLNWHVKKPNMESYKQN